MASSRDGVLIMGAGGRTGRILVDEALSAGYQVKALVRSPERAGLRPRTGLSIVTGDARDTGTLRTVIEAHDAVVSAIGGFGRNSGGLYADVARALVAAAEQSGARRLIAVTSSGVRSDDPHHPWWYRRVLIPFIKATYDDMAAMETIIEQSALDWTIVRPSRLIDEPATGRYRVEDGSNPSKGLVISRVDLARFIIADLAECAWVRRRPTLAR